jgi:uncharacterized membrane protein YkvA (DUF1232 family)
MLEKIKQQARHLKREAYALYYAARDPRVLWYARLLIALVVAHTFSPIDLIPDFIPVLGYLDDLIITPLGIALALRMIPPQVMGEARQRADVLIQQGKPVSKLGLALVIGVWLVILAMIVWTVIKVLTKPG